MNLASLLAETDQLIASLPEAEDARSHADIILARYDEIDAKLVVAGFPPTSPWWRRTIERWYRSGKRQAVLRCGRRAGKSSTLSRLAVVEVVYGKHEVPPGDVGVGAIVSTTKEPEAAARITTIEAILDALGIAHRPWGSLGLRLVGRNRGFRGFPASIKGVSGFTGIFVLCDEVSKWLDSETGANPATEVLRSIRPTMQTQPNARIVLSSSPMGMLDAHYDAFEDGETALQIVACATSWEANPTITEESTRADEPDEATWAREYAAIPQAEAETSLLTNLIVERARRVMPMPWDMHHIEGHRYVAAMDPATRGHAWTLVVATKGTDGRRRVAMAREWRGTPSVPLSPKAVLAEIRVLIGQYGLRSVTTDQHAIDHLRDLVPAGLVLIEAPWTQQSKRDAYEHVLKLLQDEQLELHPDPQVKADLLGIRKRLTRNGVTYELAEVKGRHADYAPSVALAVEDARFLAKEPEAVLDVQSAANKAKVAFLEARRMERERRERFGRLPATHARRTAR